LRSFLDIAAVVQQKTRNSMNNAQAIRAGQGQDVSVIHMSIIVAGGSQRCQNGRLRRSLT
jgi:hypothetical protein